MNLLKSSTSLLSELQCLRITWDFEAVSRLASSISHVGIGSSGHLSPVRGLTHSASLRVSLPGKGESFWEDIGRGTFGTIDSDLYGLEGPCYVPLTVALQSGTVNLENLVFRSRGGDDSEIDRALKVDVVG